MHVTYPSYSTKVFCMSFPFLFLIYCMNWSTARRGRCLPSCRVLVIMALEAPSRHGARRDQVSVIYFVGTTWDVLGPTKRVVLSDPYQEFQFHGCHTKWASQKWAQTTVESFFFPGKDGLWKSILKFLF